MRRGQRYLTVVVSILLLVLTGGTAFALVAGTSRSTEDVLQQARLQLETTVASVVGQGLNTGLVLAMNAAGSMEWSLEAGDPADAAQLQHLLRTSPLLDHGAVLLNLRGEHLNRAEPGGPLPEEGAPAYESLRVGPGQRGPVFTPVVHSDGVAIVGMAIPITAGPQLPPSAIIVGFFRLDGSLLQQYTDPVRQGETGISHILDDHQVVMAATDRSRVGRPLPSETLRMLVAAETPQFLEYTDALGRAWVASYAPTPSGWGVLTTQHASEFYGPVRTGRTRIQLGIAGVLAVAALGLGLLFHRREQALDLLQHQANHDALTGLPNRHQFTVTLESRLASLRDSGRPVAVLFCDLDGFKAVNDEHGHEAGDRVLERVGERLVATVRSSDLVARLGGDEFTVLVHDADAGCIRELADRIVDSFREPLALGGRWPAVSVGVSIGVAVGVDLEAKDLLRAADLAMYHAKLRPGSGWVLAPDGGLLDALSVGGNRTR